MENNSCSSQSFDICVIGSGFAGLTAVNYLLEHSSNTSIALIEARERTGGRIHTSLLKQLEEQAKEVYQSQESSQEAERKACVVDIGGQWIGTDHFKALSFISKYSLQLEEQIYPHFESSQDSSNQLNSLVSMVTYEFPDLSEEEITQINSFVRLVDVLGSQLSQIEPWNIEHAQELDVSIYDYVVSTTSSPRAQQEIFIFIQTILATSPHNCSFLFFLYYIASGGGMRALGDGLHGAQRWKVIGGAQKISDCLLEDLSTRPPSTNSFQSFFSSPVQSITSSSDNGINQLLIEVTNKSEKMTIKCRRVILAMSPRLSNSSIQFVPPLPPSKLSLADAMVPGAVVKVLIPFKKNFWMSEENSQPIRGTKSLEEIYPMHNMFHSTVGPFPALVGLITGDHARTFMELNSIEQRKVILQQIHDLFCPSFHASPESSPAFNPVDVIYKSWVNEPFSGGCFACLFRPNCFFSHGKYLKSPLCYPVFNSTEWLTPLVDESCGCETAVEWACTETAPMFSGYMEGAMLAGEEAAKRILVSLKAEEGVTSSS